MYIKVGIAAPFNASKKVLKDAVKADPTQVYAYGISFLGPQFGGVVSDMPEGATLSAVGPDPVRNRKWHASITRKGDKIVVS